MLTTTATKALVALAPLRCLSAVATDQTQKSVVDEMVAYARANFKGNREQALDILKSGLNFHQTGSEASRLYLAQAEIQADSGNWAEVSRLCQSAATAALESQPASLDDHTLLAELELAAASLGTRAFLTQNQDADAFHLAQQCMEVARKSFTAQNQLIRRREALVLASAVAASVQHAGGELESASESFDTVVTLVDHKDQRNAAELPEDRAVAAALKQAALFRLAQGNIDEAKNLAQRALNGAEAAADQDDSSSSDTNNNDSSSNNASIIITANPMQSPVATGELLADAHLTAGQVYMHQHQWEEAESQLTKALQAAEQVSEESHPRVAVVLSLLAGTYSRTGKVTLAEGLYRESAKMLGISPEKADTGFELKAVHPSLGALLAWRYTQLLTALPNRSTEAAAWQKLARDLFDDAPVGRVLSPETCLGTLDSLQGKGSRGYGVVVDLMMRRALACSPTAAALASTLPPPASS